MSQAHNPETIARAGEAQRLRRARLPAVLDYAFRPMFVAAGGRAVIGLALWLAMFVGCMQLPSRFDALSWHVLPSPPTMLDTAAGGVLAAALILWAFLSDHRVTGTILIAAALVNAARLSLWTGVATWVEKLLFKS